MKDPTADELRGYLQATGLCDDGDQFSVEAAIYWFASRYHGGQWSSLYSALSTSPYRPSRLATGPEPESVETELYAELVAEFGS